MTRPALGWRAPSTPHTGTRLSLSRAALDALPAAVDLEQHAPPIQDQQWLGSCVGHATARALAIRLAFQGLSRELPSPLWLYRCAREALGTVDEDSGAIIADALAAARERGFADEASWPYALNIGGFTALPPRAAFDAAEHRRLITSEPLDYDVATWRWELASGHPLCVGIRVFDGIFHPDGEGRIDLPSGDAQGGHALCVTGYDDAREALRIDNSWGTGWGVEGRGWLPYAYVRNPFWCGEIHAVRAVRTQ